ncbi:MAG TPA: hypothetical protein VIP70_00670 [Nitrososphaeraceae archaeon]
MGKPIETLFWLGTAGVLYLAASHIVKNVTNEVIRDLTRGNVFRDHERKDRRRCICR